jgi:hypothetical protein
VRIVVATTKRGFFINTVRSRIVLVYKPLRLTAIYCESA